MNKKFAALAAGAAFVGASIFGGAVAANAVTTTTSSSPTSGTAYVGAPYTETITVDYVTGPLQHGGYVELDTTTEGCALALPADVTFSATDLVITNGGATGTFTFTLTGVPAEATAGDYALCFDFYEYDDSGKNHNASTFIGHADYALTVSAEVVPGGDNGGSGDTSSLAVTGAADNSGLIAGSVAVLIAGAGAVAFAARRRSVSSK